MGYSYAIDATVIEGFARGYGVHNTKASSDTDLAWYVREGDHRDPRDVPQPASPTTNDLATTKATAADRSAKDKFVRNSNKYVFGREAHLLTVADISHPDRLYMPHLPIAFTTNIPGVDPAGAARRLFTSVLARGHLTGPVAGDILYTNQDPEQYQIPARRAGFDLVLGYGVDQLGHQGTHATGMQLIDGGYHAPCIPDHLINPIEELRTLKTITDRDERFAKHREINARIAARVEYRMRTKQATRIGDPTTGDSELKERLTCPAAGANPTAICALKPRSQKPRPIKQTDGTRLDLRRVIDHRKVLTRGEAPQVCKQETVTTTIEDGAKFRQPMPFASPEQITLYNRLRQGTEGIHGSAKDTATTALAIPGRRRVRGWAAMQLFIAFLIAETATRRIITFMRNALTDNEGNLYVPRRKRTGDHGPTGAPPGTALPGAPPVIEIEDDSDQEAA